MKKQTEISKKQYQGLGKVYEFYKKKDDELLNKEDKDEDKISTSKKSNESNLITAVNIVFTKMIILKILMTLHLNQNIQI